ncbi:CWF complex protein sap62 [Sorochytrium milnesiophthora]
MDFQNRVGSKPGSGGVAGWSESNVDRRERLRKLALETINLANDPYILRNHLGSYECKLCLTLHTNEGSYLAHTQGKKHQTNLARRAARESRDTTGTGFLQGPEAAAAAAAAAAARTAQVPKKQFIKIGRPGYRVTKVRDPSTRQLGLLFSVHFPQIAHDVRPRHRFMSAYEQRIEAPDRAWQYLVVAAEPYETISFKIPSREIDKGEGRFFTYWDSDAKQFTMQLFFR